MGQAADRDGAAVGVDELFDHPAFESLKSRASAFVVVRPSARALMWANVAAADFWDRRTETLERALFGPPGGGWLGDAMGAVVPGRAPQMFRTGLAPGLGMRGAMVLARALVGPDGVPIVGFAVPVSGVADAPAAEWRRRVGPDVLAVESPESEAEPPSPEAAVETGEVADAAGPVLARRSQLAILRDRLMSATDGVAQLRFLWRTDSRGVLTAIDDRVPGRLGAPLSAGAGPLPQAVAAFDVAAGERLDQAFTARSTWSGIAIRLPVAGGAAIAPTLLSGSPVFGRERSFEGFRGFGVVDLAGLDITPREAQPAEAISSHAPQDVALTIAADATVFHEHADAAPRAAAAAIDEPYPVTTRTAFANVVDLRSFQAVRSVPATLLDPSAPEPPPLEPLPQEPLPQEPLPQEPLPQEPLPQEPLPQEPLPQEPLAPESRPEVRTPEAAPVSDEMAFLALGAALRAQIGATGDALPEPDIAVPAAAAAAMAAPGDPSDVRLDEAARPAAADAVALLDRLSIPVLVLRDGEPAFANLAAARVLGFAGTGDLVGAGPPHATNAVPSGLTLRNVRGEPVAVEAEPTSVDWHGAPATLWTFRPGPVAALPAVEPLSAPRPEVEERSVDLIDRVDDAVALLDGEGRIRRLNERGRGWFDASAVGESVTALLAPESRAAALQLLDDARTRGEGSAVPPPHREVVARTAAGGFTPMLLTLGRLGSSGFYATLRDVSALRRAERGEALSRGERERDAGRLPDLLARVSHEIRTPLNAILGFAEVMMDERLGPLGNPRYRDYLKDIHASGTQVVTLVDDLLDLSRIEAGRLDLEVGAVDVNKVVAELVAQMQPEANRGRVIVRTSLASRISSVLADERSARQIVQHLLSNAVKFNEPGGQVIVSTAQEESGAVLLRIRDTGVGMTEAEIAAALEPFHDVSPPRPANGNGLGLPLARALVGANGASLSIRSRPREGTLVEVSFPPAPAPPEDARRPA